MEDKFSVTGMTCSACSAAVERSVNNLPGVEEVAVNLLTNSMKVVYDGNQVTTNEIEKAVEEAGYKADSLSKEMKVEKEEDVFEKMMKEKEKNLIFSILLLIPLMYIAMGPMMGLPQPAFLVGHENILILALCQMFLTFAIISINSHYFTSGFKTLIKGHPNMDSLIAIGSGAAFVYGIFAIFRIAYGLGHNNMDLVMAYGHELYFESAGTILVLIDFGKWLEARAKRRTSNAISQLMDLTPKVAKVRRNGQEVLVDVEELQIGEEIILGPGENVPVDGIVIEGLSSVDESALSGESIPVEKSQGDKLMAATTNGGGRLVFKASSVGEDTTIAKIIALVEDANATKAPISKMADKISGVFVPIVITISLVTIAFWLLSGQGLEFALRLGIAVLVISCPCALGLATPVAIMVGTGKGARTGVLFKSAETLEVLHHVDTILLDKTGTITKGKPFVTDIHGVEIGSKDLLEVAYALEKPSEHPLAKAVIDAFKREKGDMVVEEVKDFQAIAGKGLKANYKGQEIFAGNEKLLKELGIGIKAIQEQLDENLAQGKTPLLFATKDKLLGWIAAKDLLKPSSLEALKRLKKLGKETVMLTGDNEKTAHVVAKELPIDNVIAGVLPQDKEEHLRKYQEMGKKVAMVGDGINDAPALARADVGIAIGAGTDIAIESADLVLMKSNLLDVAKSIQLSKGTIKNIKQNLFWAFFYNIICIPIAAGIFYRSHGLTLNPMMAAFAMSFSSIFVVLNALRLNFIDLGKTSQDAEEEDGIEEILYFDHKPLHTKNVEGYKNKEESKEDTKMQKVLELSGMTCQHCVKHVEKALNDLEGVEAKVSLHPQEAIVETDKVSDDKLKEAVEEIGYRVISIR